MENVPQHAPEVAYEDPQWAAKAEAIKSQLAEQTEALVGLAWFDQKLDQWEPYLGLLPGGSALSAVVGTTVNGYHALKAGAGASGVAKVIAFQGFDLAAEKAAAPASTWLQSKATRVKMTPSTPIAVGWNKVVDAATSETVVRTAFDAAVPANMLSYGVVSQQLMKTMQVARELGLPENEIGAIVRPAVAVMRHVETNLDPTNRLKSVANAAAAKVLHP